MNTKRIFTRIWPLVVAFFVALILTLYPLPTTFDITAQTENFNVTTAIGHRSRWYLENVKIFGNFRTDSFTGSLQIEPGVRVSLNRIALGPFRIRCRSVDPQVVVATLYDTSDKVVQKVQQRLDLMFDDLSNSRWRDKSVVITFVGETEIGDEIRLDPGPRSALLRSGKISILGHSLLDRESLFKGDVISLNTGDLVTIDGADECVGLVVVNEKPAFKVAVRCVGKEAKVTRFASKGYIVSTSTFDRIKNDKPLQAAWAVVLLIAGLTRKIMTSKGDKE